MRGRISFRDPDGFVYKEESWFYRIVFNSFRQDLELIENSNLLSHPGLVKHDKLAEEHWPAGLKQYIQDSGFTEVAYVFKLTTISCITYPWEWTPLMLAEAGLFTIRLQKELVSSGFSLKDASFYNIQFINGLPVFIDLLSIKSTASFYPWIAYGQLLKHFIFPLTLVKYGKFSSLQFLSSFPDGVDKNQLAPLLPSRSYLNVFELLNVHLLKRISDKPGVQTQSYTGENAKLKAFRLLDFAEDYLKAFIKNYSSRVSVWTDYYERNTDADYLLLKRSVISQMIQSINPHQRAVDLGCNTGEISMLLHEYFDELVAVESDVAACELFIKTIQPVAYAGKEWTIINGDLVHPSPAIGWMNNERQSLLSRIKAPVVFSLALIHHLYFTGSIDFEQISAFFSDILQQRLIIEFVEPADEKVVLVSKGNTDRLGAYSLGVFIQYMTRYFELIETKQLAPTRLLLVFDKL